MKVIAIDIGGTKIASALVTFDEAGACAVDHVGKVPTCAMEGGPAVLVRVIEQVRARLEDVGRGVVGVVELLRHPHVLGVGVAHGERCVEALLDGLADIPFVVDEHDLCTVRLAELAALLGDGIGHDDAYLVALDRADERKADALVAARGLYDDAVGMQQAALLGAGDHRGSHARLDGASHLESFEFDEDLGHTGLHELVQAHERRMSGGIDDVLIDHCQLLGWIESHHNDSTALLP